MRYPNIFTCSVSLLLNLPCSVFNGIKFRGGITAALHRDLHKLRTIVARHADNNEGEILPAMQVLAYLPTNLLDPQTLIYRFVLRLARANEDELNQNCNRPSSTDSPSPALPKWLSPRSVFRSSTLYLNLLTRLKIQDVGVLSTETDAPVPFGPSLANLFSVQH